MSDNKSKNKINPGHRKGIEPISDYLYNAYKALEEKKISCNWKKYEKENEYKIDNLYLDISQSGKCCYKLYTYDGTKITTKIIENELLLKNENLEIGIGKGSERQKITISKDEMDIDQCIFYCNDIPDEIEIQGYKIIVSNINSAKEYKSGFFSEDKKNEISKNKCYKVTDYTDKKIEELIGKNSFKKDNNSYTIENKEHIEKLSKDGFKISKIESKEKWIQIEEIDAKDDNPSDDPLKHFFDKEMQITDSKKERFQIKEFDKEEKLLRLKKDGNNNEDVYPEKGKLTTKPNMHNIRQQQAAIKGLNSYWEEQEPLAKLLRPLENSNDLWKIFYKKEINEWKILHDETFNGYQEQREFVQKALATPDFAFLDGPPGTGKTTVILELIYQIVKLKKRVLLCASTHAAINNVLERIVEHKLDNIIFPYRVGDSDRAAGVEKFTAEELNKKVGEKNKRLVIESSNLMCGTTTGISKIIQDNKEWMQEHVPIFDYLIIDECSKTTFQEFLVPAMYAKKWVLSGDIKQLSPFSDREEICSNLENIGAKDSTQKACHILAHFYKYDVRYIVVESENVIKGIYNELKARIEKENSEDKKLNTKFKDIFMAICSNDRLEAFNNNKMYFLNKESSKDDEYAFLKLAAYDIIFIEKNLFEKHKKELPVSHILVGNDDYLNTEFFFRHNAFYGNKYSVDDRNRKYETSYDIAKFHNDYLKNKKWSEEIVWRLERIFWLRQSSKSTKYIKDEIELLYPRSVYSIGKISRIEDIAFVSILEALTGDGIRKQERDEKTTLNQGFPEEIKKCRSTTLKYQHRMHPNISAFPAKQFYNSESLKNGNKISREWGYSEYKGRSHWLDVNGETKDNSNKKEANAIKIELEKFLEWTIKNPHLKNEKWEIAILTFYKAQEKLLREMLQKFTGLKKNSRFELEKKNVNIKLATVDFFQGQEADLVFLSMVNTYRDGFMDSPNRLNVALTRGRYQLVIVGKIDYYEKKSSSDELKRLSMHHSESKK